MTRLVRTAFGRTFALDVPDEFVEAAVNRLPFGSQPTDNAPERSWTVDVAGGLDVVGGEIELWVAEHAVGFIFVHAGAVAVDGRAIVIPGRTMSGKSTLVAALVRAGATYYSDEYAAIDGEGRVHAYARLLSIRGEGGGQGVRTPVAHLGGVAGHEPVPLALVAHLQYDSAAGWAVDELTRGQTALALIDNTVPAQTRPVEVMDHLQAATNRSRGLRGTRGDATETADILMTMLAS